MPEPIKVELEVGKQYAWCTESIAALCEFGAEEDCHNRGRIVFTADRTEAYICSCKQTKSPPFCDGSHKQLSDAKD